MAGSVTEDNKALYGIIPSAVLLLRDDELLFARVSLKWLPAGTWVLMLTYILMQQSSIERRLVKFVPGAFLC
jgi:hypothetical protein